MICNLCQQSDYISLHGRLLCGSCGNKAGERLGQFQSKSDTPKAEKIYSDHTLDLSKKTTKNNPSAQTHAGQQSDSRSVPPPGSLDLRALTPQTPAELNAPPAAYINPTTMQPQATYPVKADTTPPNLQHANENAYTPRPKRKRLSMPSFGNLAWMRLATVTAGMLLLVGYVTYLNYPNIAVRVAASRANIDASMPGYLPAGYGFDGPVTYNTGKLTLTFSGSDGNIALSQAQTKWDSQSLLDNHVRQQTSKYSTYQENGLTIYTYDNRFAVWVNGGIMYQIEASEFLDPDDIVKMASSL